MYITWKIERVPFVEDTYDTVNTEIITSFYNPSVRVSLGSTKDSFQFYLVNSHNQWSNKFHNLDKITLYRVLNSATTSTSNILMTGVVGSASETRNSRTANLLVKGYNYTEAILGALVVTDPKSTSTTIPYAIADALEAIKGDSPETFPVEWSTDNSYTDSTGGAFPVVDEPWFNTPLISKIEKYSKNTATEDGTYMYWVDYDNKFHWIKKGTAINYEFDATTEYFHSVKPDVDKNDVINYVLMQGGVDPKGSPINTEYVDEASKAKYGTKYYYDDSDASFAANLNVKDIFNEGYSSDEGTLPFSYPFTPVWSSTAVTSDTDYTNKLRVYVENYLYNKGKDIVELKKFGRFKLNYTFPAGTKLWGLGDVISVIYYDANLDDNTTKQLRVEDIQYTTTTDVFQLIEDEGTI